MLALVFVLAVGGGQAPEAPPTSTPPSVRVHLRNEDIVQGFLRGRSADELVVFTSNGRYRHVPFGDVRRFEVRGRTGSHLERGALIGVIAWAAVMGAAAIDSLDEAGWASWPSGAILAAGAGVGAAVGATVPRYGWRPADPRTAWSSRATAPGPRLTLRF